MASSVTVKDIARIAEVSIGTVSRVFNNHTNVTEETRQRVLKAATDLGYFGTGTGKQEGTTRERNARALKEIGFLFYSPVEMESGSANPFWLHVFAGVEREARKSNIKVTYCSINELLRFPESLWTTLYEMKLGGILLVGPTSEELARQIQSISLPLVLVDNYFPDIPLDAVLCDNFEGARRAVDELIAQGHQRIAFIGGPLKEGCSRPTNSIYSFERRAAGYRTALLDAGLPIHPQLYESSLITPEGGYEACKRLLASREPFTALFCANDNTALGALKALREAELRVPEDISLVGFDDLDMVEYLTPPLTTVRVHKEAIGAAAVKSLLLRAADMDAMRVTSIVDVELIKRASVRSLLS